jgi:mannose-6-phosphate isomerase-like protein (cupin superfamily)
MNIDQPHIDDVDLCVVHTHNKQMIDRRLAALLEPVDPATFHQYVLPPRTPVELHYHEIDEYWWFTSGTPVVTLWTPASGLREYQLEPGDMVACLRGVAHTLWADHTVTYYQFSSVLPAGKRRDHMTAGLPPFDAHRGGEK